MKFSICVICHLKIYQVVNAVGWFTASRASSSVCYKGHNDICYPHRPQKELNVLKVAINTREKMACLVAECTSGIEEALPEKADYDHADRILADLEKRLSH